MTLLKKMGIMPAGAIGATATGTCDPLDPDPKYRMRPKEEVCAMIIGWTLLTA